MVKVKKNTKNGYNTFSYGFTDIEKIVLWVLLMGSPLGTSALFILYVAIIINLPRIHEKN